MGSSLKVTDLTMARRLRDAAAGNADACFELGMAFSSGLDGVPVDLVEAHKWFNLSALNGSAHAQRCRAEIAGDMTAREIAEAQRQARAWLRTAAPRYAA